MKEEKTGEESAERCSSPALRAVHWALCTGHCDGTAEESQSVSARSGFRNHESQFL